jgi:hypothetical protein
MLEDLMRRRVWTWIGAVAAVAGLAALASWLVRGRHPDDLG